MSTDRKSQLRRGAAARRAAALLVACGLLLALALPAAAPAARGLVTGLTGPDQYQSADPATRSLWLGRTVDAGAGIVRLSINWATLAPTQRPAAPTDPASYDLSSVDGALRDAASRGLKVLITVNTAPTWAEGPGRPASATEGSWKPNPADLADFIQAIASRYSGNFDPDGVGPQPALPSAEAVQVWNEPNQDFWLAPQFQGKEIIGADYYREMLNAAYKAVKAVNPKMLVVTGGTSPYGDPPGGPYPPGGARVRPVQWWQKLLCVTPTKSKKPKKGKKSKPTKYVPASNCSGRAMFDVFAHQSIDNTGKGPLQSGPSRDDASTPDLGRVVSVLRGAEKAGTLPGGQHPVWVTEFWWDSKPPNPVGAPPLTQARWLEQSLYLFWKAGASTAINFEIQDSTLFPNTRNGFQSGLYFLDGRPKPALTAFHFPFVTDRTTTKRLNAWGKSPEAGSVAIQRKQGARWRTIKRLQVSKGGVFFTKLSLPGKQQLRATVGASQSLVWKQAATVRHASAAAAGGGGGGPSTTAIILLLIGGIAFIGVGAASLRRRHVRKQARPWPATG